MATYYASSGLSWKQYLQANSFVQDITGSIQKTGKETSYAISEQAKQIITSNDTLSSISQQGFDKLGQKLDSVNLGIEQLGASFEWGMGLLIEQAKIQNQFLQGILERLDAIHLTLKTPTLTQAREFYNIGQDRLNKGFFDKALEAFHKAEEKNDTDFLTQFAIGHLCLYGCNDDCDVINLSKAQQYFCNAARYARAEIKHLPEAKKYCGEAYFHASVACYVQAKECQLTGDDTYRSKLLLHEAIELSQKATAIYPELAEAFYQSAKANALTGNADVAINSLAVAIQTDRNYCLKADNDHDFDQIRHRIIDLFRRLQQETAQKIKIEIERLGKFRDEYIYLTDSAQKIKTTIENTIEKAEQAYQNGTYFDCLDAQAWIEKQPPAEFQRLFVPDQLIATLYEYDPVFHVEFSPNSQYLAASVYEDDKKGTIRLWDIFLKKCIASFEGHEEIFGLLAFSPDGQYLVSVSGHDTIRLWDISSRQCVATFKSLVRTVAFSPDNCHIASGGHEKVIRVWNIASKQCVAILEGHKEWVPSIAFSPDGKYLASGSTDKTIRLWDISSRQCVATLHSSEFIWSIAFSPDGKRLVSGGKDSTIRLWDISSNRCVATLAGHSDEIWSVAFSPNGSLVGSGGADNKIRIWDITSRQCVATFRGHGRNFMSVTFSPNGYYFASGGFDKMIKLWGQHIIPTRELETLKAYQQKNPEPQAQKKEYYRQQGRCEQCGAVLGFLDKMTGKTTCKHCQKYRK